MTEEYVKTVWTVGDILTSAGINAIETQLEETTDGLILMEEALEAIDTSDIKYTPMQVYRSYLPSKKVTSAILKGHTDLDTGLSYMDQEVRDDCGFQYIYLKDYSLLKIYNDNTDIVTRVTINGGNVCVFNGSMESVPFNHGEENEYALTGEGIYLVIFAECEEMELTIEGDNAFKGNFADLGHVDRLKSFTLTNQNNQRFYGNIGDLFEIIDTLNLSGCSKLTGVYSACADVVPKHINLNGTGCSATDIYNTLVNIDNSNDTELRDHTFTADVCDNTATDYTNVIQSLKAKAYDITIGGVIL